MNFRCFLIGHRDVKMEIGPILLQSIEQHIIDYGVCEFWVGRQGGFDYLAARCLLEIKKLYPAVRLIQLFPYHPGERKTDLWPGFDHSIYPEGQESVPRKLGITRANRYAIANCHYLIGYAWQPGSNSVKLMEAAVKRGNIVTNLAEKTGGCF